MERAVRNVRTLEEYSYKLASFKIYWREVSFNSVLCATDPTREMFLVEKKEAKEDYF